MIKFYLNFCNKFYKIEKKNHSHYTFTNSHTHTSIMNKSKSMMTTTRQNEKNEKNGINSL